MGAETTISWTEKTWNPWIGCTAVSPACAGCYAAARAKRYGEDFAVRRRTSAHNWHEPMRWNRQADAEGRRFRVFCASLADVFDNQVDPGWRRDFWQVVLECQHLDWQLLTKRPMNIADMLPDWWGNGPDHVWLGTTVEDMKTAAQRLPHLISIPAKVRFVSAEPMLERVDLDRVRLREGLTLNALTGYYTPPQGIGIKGYAQLMQQVPEPIGGKVHWVIAGGESGPGARTMMRSWDEGLRLQCRTHGVAYWRKQLGSKPDPAWRIKLTGKADKPAEWPEHLRVQELPRTPFDAREAA